MGVPKHALRLAQDVVNLARALQGVQFAHLRLKSWWRTLFPAPNPHNTLCCAGGNL
ncbi:hypothetical protein ANRL4_02575 [Anaerolineae bacterium]|nr:hypothetical protein ANRL4_02575 [Anaerolineae bacterium]